MTDYPSSPGQPGTPGRLGGPGQPLTGIGQPPGVPGQPPGSGYTDPTLYPPNAERPGQPPRSDNPATAQDEARRVADTTREAGANVAQTAKDQAAGVATEAKEQAASLLSTVRSEVGQQASTQQHRIAEALHGLSDELGSMASSSPESGPLTQLAKEGARRGGEVAHWLSEREPGDVLEEVRMYARRRPVTFLALCGLTGLVAGRLTRSAVATRTSLDSQPTDDRPRAVAGPLAAPTSSADPLATAPPVDPRIPPSAGTGPATPPRDQATASGW
jgi:hypothetical protein